MLDCARSRPSQAMWFGSSAEDLMNDVTRSPFQSSLDTVQPVYRRYTLLQYLMSLSPFMLMGFPAGSVHTLTDLDPNHRELSTEDGWIHFFISSLRSSSVLAAKLPGKQFPDPQAGFDHFTMTYYESDCWVIPDEDKKSCTVNLLKPKIISETYTELKRCLQNPLSGHQ